MSRLFHPAPDDHGQAVGVVGRQCGGGLTALSPASSSQRAISASAKPSRRCWWLARRNSSACGAKSTISSRPPGGHHARRLAHRRRPGPTGSAAPGGPPRGRPRRRAGRWRRCRRGAARTRAGPLGQGVVAGDVQHLLRQVEADHLLGARAQQGQHAAGAASPGRPAGAQGPARRPARIASSTACSAM